MNARKAQQGTSDPAGGRVGVSLRRRIALALQTRHVADHPQQLHEHQRGEEGQHRLLGHGGSLVREREHEGEAHEQQVDAVLRAQHLAILLRVFPAEAAAQRGQNLHVARRGRGRGRRGGG